MSFSADQRYSMKLKALIYLYEEGLTQTEIAKKLHVSRVTLGKLLDEARAEGMIKFEIIDVRGRMKILQLEKRMRDTFGLDDIHLVDCPHADQDTLNRRIGSEAASYVQRVLRSGMRIGLTWGRTLGRMIEELPHDSQIRDLMVYTLVGGASTSSSFQPNLLAQQMISKYNGRTFIITAPFICRSEELCRAIKQEPAIASILNAAHDLDLTLVGIGEEPQEGADHLSDYPFDAGTVQDLVRAGAAGDICGNFFTVSGELCRTPINDRIVSVNLKELASHKCVIGMGGGERKIHSILGALNGHYLHALITDVQTAEKVMEAAAR